MSSEDILGQYKDHFARNYNRPFIYQLIGGTWRTVHRNLGDEYIKAHVIDQTSWSGTFSPWYVQYGILDFDNPDMNFLQQTIKHLKFERGQFLLMTSPSYSRDNSLHLLFRPVMNNLPPTNHKYHGYMNNAIDFRSGKCELYPSTSRGCRLPFGRDQELLSLDDGLLIPQKLLLQDKLYWVDKLEPFSLDKWSKRSSIEDSRDPLQAALQFDYDLDVSKSSSKGAFFYENGILGFHTRHSSTFYVICLFFARNVSKENATYLAYEWTKTKHNKLSDKVNHNRWDVITKDIRGLVEWVYSTFERKLVYPDTVHNETFAIYKSDIHFIAKVFNGNISKQKKLFKLIGHYRARGRDKLYISCNDFWCKMDNYIKFQEELIRLGILEKDDKYARTVHSKAFKMNLPAVDSEPLKANGRNINDFNKAVLKVYRTRIISKSALNIPGSTAYTL